MPTVGNASHYSNSITRTATHRITSGSSRYFQDEGSGTHPLWWPGLEGEIEALVKSCQPCHEAKQAPPKSPLHPWSWPCKPWERVHLDFAGPFMGKTFLLAHSKWGEVQEMSSTVTDNGPQFVSQEFADFMKSNGVDEPHGPSSNSLVCSE